MNTLWQPKREAAELNILAIDALLINSARGDLSSR
jgi:hypothetical protein